MNARCPVCNQPVDPATSPSSSFRDVTYYLRCPHCKERFDADQERFLAEPGRGCEHEPEGHELQLMGSERRLQ